MRLLPTFGRFWHCCYTLLKTHIITLHKNQIYFLISYTAHILILLMLSIISLPSFLSSERQIFYLYPSSTFKPGQGKGPSQLVSTYSAQLPTMVWTASVSHSKLGFYHHHPSHMHHQRVWRTLQEALAGWRMAMTANALQACLSYPRQWQVLMRQRHLESRYW